MSDTERPYSFMVTVTPIGDWDSAEVRISGNRADKPPFAVLIMSAAEYLTYIAASESGAGFERAMELIAEGAMTYRHKVRPE